MLGRLVDYFVWIYTCMKLLNLRLHYMTGILVNDYELEGNTHFSEVVDCIRMFFFY